MAEESGSRVRSIDRVMSDGWREVGLGQQSYDGGGCAIMHEI